MRNVSKTRCKKTMFKSMGPFHWSNVPRMLILVAVITTAVTVIGGAAPGSFGSQTLTFPVLCVFTGVWWLAVWLTGRRPYPDEPPPASQQETAQARASREFAEAQPSRGDYEAAAASLKTREDSSFHRILERDEELSKDHHFDERV